MSRLLLHAPLSGWAMPLDQVPDPVFAERMMGDGIAIDPLDGLVVAPAAARVSAAPASAHAITLELANGAHLLIHVGLETVALGGEGFELCVHEGQQVAAGDALIRFDLDRVARRAKSLISPIVLIDPGFSLAIEAIDRLVRPGEPILSVSGRGEAAAARSPDGEPWIARSVPVLLPDGLHARPAARIVQALKAHDTELRIDANGRSADARSMVGLLALGLRSGAEARLSARGGDAEGAIAAVAALLQEEGREAPAHRVATSIPSPATEAGSSNFRAIAAAPGLALGPVAQFRAPSIEVPTEGAGMALELRALEAAIADVAAALQGGGDIAQAHLAILEDPELLAHARGEIAEGRSAGQSWRSATETAAASIRATGERLLIERIADLEDVERQLLSRLAGAAAALPEVEAGTILIAEDLLPSQFLALRSSLAGVVTAAGGATSHVAILAGAAGIPMLVGAGPGILALPDGRRVVLDADTATLIGDPDPAELAEAGKRLAARSARRAAEIARAQEACRMLDGSRIEIFANLAELSEAQAAVAAGAEGCGLLRTEFLFLGRSEAPSEDEQAKAYRAIAAALDGRPLILRTLDIGADKQVGYLPLPREENPALGRRGVRLSLAHPDLLRSQLRAILRGVPPSQCRIMLPMVTDREELRAVRSMLDGEAVALGRRDRVQLGVMIETPAAALISASLAEEADFFSVGTNDLTQYALACDRLNPETAGRADALHPAVLQLIRAAATGAARHGRWIGVCGGLASDPAAAAILIGLGIGELSAAPAIIPELKATVRRLDREGCTSLAERALRCASAEEVRALISSDPESLRGAA